MRADFTPASVDGAARTGVVTTARGSFRTPCFMPVGTRGAVKYLDAADMEALGAQVVLANTYHLMLRPGADVVESLGGLSAMSGWPGLTLTDSGGYQVFSLEPTIDDGGAEFRSVYDGSTHTLTPEGAVDLQIALGADIQMVLDVCSALPSPDDVIRVALDRTAAWAERARRRFLDHPTASEWQSQFGIVQGGLDGAMRRESAERTVALGFDGYAVGGLSVGEARTEWHDALTSAVDALPADQPRYFMGLGDPAGIVDAVARGIDMFDCVLPTRLGRHGTLLTSEGRLNITRAEYTRSDDPIDSARPDSPVAGYSRGYLRHLFQVNEPTAKRLATLHNLHWLFAFVTDLGQAIEQGRLQSFTDEVHAVWG